MPGRALSCPGIDLSESEESPSFSFVHPGLRPASDHKCEQGYPWPGAGLSLRSQAHDGSSRAHLMQKEPHCPGGIAEG